MDEHLQLIHACTGAATFRGVPCEDHQELLRKLLQVFRCANEGTSVSGDDDRCAEASNFSEPDDAMEQGEGSEKRGQEEVQELAEQELWRYVQELVKQGSKGQERRQFVRELVTRGLEQLLTLPVEQPKGKEARHKRLGERFMKKRKRGNRSF